MADREIRVLSNAQLRSATPRALEGYAAVFNMPAQITPVWAEIIAPGAFTRAIRERQDVRCLFNHDTNIVLGRTKSGTLSLSEDTKGLAFRCELPDSQTARELHESIKRGDISECSFAFRAVDEKWTEGGKTRELRDLDLFDVSPVVYPAYEGTAVQARQLATSCYRMPPAPLDGEVEMEQRMLRLRVLQAEVARDRA